MNGRLQIWYLLAKIFGGTKWCSGLATLCFNLGMVSLVRSLPMGKPTSWWCDSYAGYSNRFQLAFETVFGMNNRPKKKRNRHVSSCLLLQAVSSLHLYVIVFISQRKGGGGGGAGGSKGRQRIGGWNLSFENKLLFCIIELFRGFR